MENFNVFNTPKDELLYTWTKAIIIQKHLDDKNMAERPPLGAPQGSWVDNEVHLIHTIKSPGFTTNFFMKDNWFKNHQQS